MLILESAHCIDYSAMLCKGGYRLQTVCVHLTAKPLNLKLEVYLWIHSQVTKAHHFLWRAEIEVMYICEGNTSNAQLFQPKKLS